MYLIHLQMSNHILERKYLKSWNFFIHPPNQTDCFLTSVIGTQWEDDLKRKIASSHNVHKHSGKWNEFFTCYGLIKAKQNMKNLKYITEPFVRTRCDLPVESGSSFESSSLFLPSRWPNQTCSMLPKQSALPVSSQSCRMMPSSICPTQDILWTADLLG